MTSATLSNLIMPAPVGNAPPRLNPRCSQDGPARRPDQPQPAAKLQDRPAQAPHSEPKNSQQPETPRPTRKHRSARPAENDQAAKRQDVRRKLRELFERLGLETAALENVEIPADASAQGKAQLRETLARQLGFADAKAMNAAIQTAQAAPEVGENVLAAKQHMLDGPGGKAPKASPDAPATTPPKTDDTAALKTGDNSLAAHRKMIDGPAEKPALGENGLAAKPQNLDGPIETPKITAGHNGLAADPQKLDGPVATSPTAEAKPAASAAGKPVSNAAAASQTTPDAAAPVENSQEAPAPATLDAPQTAASPRPATRVVTNEMPVPPAQSKSHDTTSAPAQARQGKSHPDQPAAQTSPQQNPPAAKPAVTQTPTATTKESAAQKSAAAQPTGQLSQQGSEAARDRLAEALVARATEQTSAKTKAKENNGRAERVRREYGLQSSEQSRPAKAAPKTDAAQNTEPSRPTETLNRAAAKQDEAQTASRYAPQANADNKSAQAKAVAVKAARSATVTSNNDAPAASNAPETTSPAPVSPTAAASAPRSTAETQVLDQVATAIRYQATPETRSMTVRLDPPELGRVHIDIRSDAEGIRGVVQVENTRTLAELQREAPQLLERLQEAGIRVKDLEFQMNDPGRGDQNNGQGQQAQNAYAQFSDGQGHRGQTWATEQETGSTLGSIFDNDETPDDRATDDTYVGSDALNVMI